MGMIESSRSALLVFQRALDTTSHNIANVHTEGYSRQKVDLNAMGSTNPNDSTAPGGGVEISKITRSFDQVLTDSVRYDSSAYGKTETFAALTEDIDRLFSSGDSNLASQVQNYFSAVQDVSNDPTSIASRQVLLGETDMLTARFREMDNRLDEISAISNSRLMQTVSEINGLGQQIAEVNLKIQDSGENIPLDLLDARDNLVNKLADKVSVDSVVAHDGSVSVFTGDGQALVIGSSSQHIGVIQSEFQGDGFKVVLGDAKVDVTEQMSGGIIGGILEFQSDVQRPAQNEIGRLAAVMAESFNELHREGYDLDGNTGVDYFSYSGPTVVESTNNSGNAVITASFVTTTGQAYDIDSSGIVDADDIAQLRGKWQASDYELVDKGGTWSLTRLSDNTSVALTANGNGTVTTADGFELNININASVGAQSDGDRFLIRPFQNTAADITVAIDSPREFAAANSIDPAYELEYLGLSGADNKWKITRLSDGFSTTVTDIGAGGTLTATDTTLSGSGPGLFDEGFEITVPGAPTLGDKYEIHPFDSSASELTTTVVDKAKIIERNVLNTSGWDTYSGGIRSGNNENSLVLAALQTDRLIGSGTATMNDAYNQLVSDVGIKTSMAKTSMTAQGIMLEQSRLARDNVSGVNLDEEAADLIKYQQAYQAAAKVMAAADQMFKTLMSSLG